MFVWFHKLGSPRYFYAIAGRLIPWLAWACALLMAVGLYQGLVVSPPDYQQGDTIRIMYVHVPSAWLSLFAYVVMASAAAVHLIWRIKLADIVAAATAPIGASFTFLALATGSLWGRPTWFTWWVWDGRLTSELILLFLYLGYIGLRAAVEDPRNAARASAVLALVGAVNVPIIHYSVVWWSTLHQGSTVFRAGGPSIHISQLIPLALMGLAFTLFYLTIVLIRARTEVLHQERRSAWVKEVLSKP